ncbi:MAG: hypothetical protein RIF32_07135 [Leptospirales bacterium]|jgi:hypothetical protein
MDHKALIEKAVEILKCQSETEDGSDFILELELEEDRNQIVYVWLDDETELEHADQKAYVYLEADVAGYEEGVDAAALLREASEFVMCRLYIDEEEGDNIAVQAALPLGGLTPEMLAAAIWETATEADRLEDLLEEE